MASTASDATPRPAFAPCVEDCQTCARHPDPGSNTLRRVCRSLLTEVHLAMVRHSSEGVVSATGTASGETDNSAASHYAALWGQRGSVPDFMRREWLETALVCARQQHAPAAAFDWLLGRPLFVPCEDSTPAGTGGRWALWEDPARGRTGLHYLSISITTPQAFRPGDVRKLEGDALPARVRAWLDAASGAPSLGLDMEASTALAPAGSGEDDRELCRLLASMQAPPPSSLPPPTTTLPGPHDGCGDREFAQRQLRGAVRYRMLLELTCCRLHERPRCTLSWRLLATVLSTLVATAGGVGGGCDVDQTHVALTAAMRTYILGYMVPYLEMRDRYVSAVHHALTYSLREELRRVARGGLWTATGLEVMDSAPEGGALTLSDPAERVHALGAALRAVCGFHDAAPGEEPPRATAAPVPWTVVLGYSQDGAVDEVQDVAKDVADLFSSAAARRRALARFLATYFLVSPVVAFDRGAASAAASTTTAPEVRDT